MRKFFATLLTVVLVIPFSEGCGNTNDNKPKENKSAANGVGQPADTPADTPVAPPETPATTSEKDR